MKPDSEEKDYPIESFSTDVPCGPAAICGILLAEGRTLPPLQAFPNGEMSIYQIVESLNRYGVSVEARSISREELLSWPGLSILHLRDLRKVDHSLKSGHFVVASGKSGEIVIVEPTTGKRYDSGSVESILANNWTGAAVLVTSAKHANGIGPGYLALSVLLMVVCAILGHYLGKQLFCRRLKRLTG